MELVDAGHSYEGRVIKGVKLSFSANKPAIFLEGGIHACEWISPATVTYLINAFLTSDQPKVRQLAQAYDWYIFPVLNPDGYVYTHTTVSISFCLLFVTIIFIEKYIYSTESYMAKDKISE